MSAPDSRPRTLSARVLWGDQVVARSDAAVEILAQERPVALGFPAADVRWDLLRDEGRRDPQAPGSALYSLSGTMPPPRARAWSASGGPDRVDGRDAVRRHEDSGLVVFDHERVRVELLSPHDDDPGEVGVVLFPAWGDVADLLAVLDVQREADGSWTGPAAPDSHRPVVEASQMLAQALVAATRQSGGRRAVSAHLAFFRMADARRPLSIVLTELSAGRTFTTYRVEVGQDGRARAEGTLLMDATAPDVVAHEVPAPPCPGPGQSAPYDMGVLGRDLRVVDDAYTDDPDAPAGPPVLDAWVRFRGVPDDAALHLGLLAQFTGHMTIAAALRPHEGVGQAQSHVSLSTGVNALHLSLHRDVRMDEWVRYHHHAVTVSGGLAHGENAVYDQAGRRLASFTAACMLRGFAGTGDRDARSAL